MEPADGPGALRKELTFSGLFARLLCCIVDKCQLPAIVSKLLTTKAIDAEILTLKGGNLTKRFSRKWLVFTLLGLIAVAVAVRRPLATRADDAHPPPFDFNDAYYAANGINPTMIRERAGTAARNPLHWTVDNSNTDPNHRNIRILETTGGFNNSGSLIYYSIMGTVFPDTFSSDAAGENAKAIANHFRAFIFPKDPNHTGNVILSPAPPNRRQDNLFDTRDGYFSNNPLGLWILAFPVYTPKAFTPEGQAILASIGAMNGFDLDGTPKLTTADLIDDLASKGILQIRTRAQDGSQGFPWVI